MFKIKKRNLKFSILQIFTLVIIIAICKFISNSTFAKSQSTTPPPFEITKTEKIEKADKNNKMVGLWITYLDLNVGNSPDPEKEFKSRYENMVSAAIKNNVNTLIVHVRPFADALYPSKTSPWSHLLTGVQGQEPGYDPLEYMVKKAHENGLKFHAWVNPYRVSINDIPNKLCASHPYYTLDAKDSINYEGGISYNPASEKVQNMVDSEIKEIVSNYDVDGVHMDDRFYPEHPSAITNDLAYKEYCQNGGKMGIHQWRAKHVNSLVKKVYKSIKEIKPDVAFGISPSGSINHCNHVGADIKTWCEGSGYIDYICPQIYWSLDFSVMPFEKTAREWRELVQNKNNLYCGLALYKIGTQDDSGTWQGRDDIIASEFSIAKKLNYNGIILYSYKQLCSPEAEKEMQNFRKEFEESKSN